MRSGSLNGAAIIRTLRIKVKNFIEVLVVENHRPRRFDWRCSALLAENDSQKRTLIAWNWSFILPRVPILANAVEFPAIRFCRRGCHFSAMEAPRKQRHHYSIYIQRGRQQRTRQPAHQRLRRCSTRQ